MPPKNKDNNTAVGINWSELLGTIANLSTSPTPQMPATEYSTLTPTEKMLQNREATHGNFTDNATKAAAIFNAWTGHNLAPVDICKVLQALKMAREAGNPEFTDHRDDQQGYIELRKRF